MNADWLMLTWTGVAFVGLVVSVVGLHSAQMAVWFARGEGANGPRKMVAEATRRRELIRMGVQSAFVGAGLAAMFDDQRTFVIAFLLTGSICTVANSILDRIDARRLRQYLLSHENSFQARP